MQSIISLEKGSWSVDHTPSLTARSMFFYVQSAGYFKCKPRYMTRRKNYNTMLLLYTIKGAGTLKYRNQTYIVESGQGFLIDCMDYQYYSVYKKDKWEFKWLHFNGSESRSYFERIYENKGPVFELSPNSLIPDYMDEIADMIRNRDYRIDIISSCRIVEILTELLLDDYKGYREGFETPIFINKAIEMIEKNYYKDIKLDTLANHVGVSKYHLSRMFKRYTGYSPYEYILNYRLNQSKELLKTTELPIYEIAGRVGFESSSHYIKQFRNQEGITPLKFREYWR